MNTNAPQLLFKLAPPIPNRLGWLALGLPGLLWMAGCNQPAEPERADRSTDSASLAVESTAPAEDVQVEARPGERVAVAATPLTPAPASTEPTVVDDLSDREPLEAPPETLGIGDKSPGIHIAKWIKGEPVDAPLTGKVHVVEFWATWCGPCRTGMPHISELQHTYPDDVAFVGVTRENEETVQKFLEQVSPDGRPWQDVIQYRLAIDDRDWTNTAYMRAAGQNGIPCAFVVGRDGIVEWIGHPASIDEPLKKIVDGDWDRDAAIAEYKQQQKLKEVSMKIAQLARASDWDGALELLDEVEAEVGKSAGLLSYRLRLLESAGRTEDASSVRSDVIDSAWDNPNALNEIAWNTATAASSGKVDLELALKAATRASELRDNKDAMILDTLARCHYELGNLDEAINWQRKAVEYNRGMREIDASLERYLNEKGEGESADAEKDDAASSSPEATPEGEKQGDL